MKKASTKIQKKAAEKGETRQLYKQAGRALKENRAFNRYI